MLEPYGEEINIDSYEEFCGLLDQQREYTQEELEEMKLFYKESDIELRPDVLEALDESEAVQKDIQLLSLLSAEQHSQADRYPVEDFREDESRLMRVPGRK